jgi:hypothetical protein
LISNVIVRNANLNTSYTAADFINPGAFDPRDKSQEAFVVLNAGYVLAIVFGEYKAYTEQDALHEAVDRGKLDGLECDATELADYQIGTDSKGNPEYEGISWLGNASEPFANESLDIWIMPASTFSEDPALMSPERVTNYLEGITDKADTQYQAVDVHSPEWYARYRALNDLEDALTLVRFAQVR